MCIFAQNDWGGHIEHKQLNINPEQNRWYKIYESPGSGSLLWRLARNNYQFGKSYLATGLNYYPKRLGQPPEIHANNGPARK